MRDRKILVMGLPGAGKTTLARILAGWLGAVYFNADEVRANVYKDLGFTPEDRIEQARRMGWLCDRVVAANGTALADFVCPTVETRKAFWADGPGMIVWVRRIDKSRYPDTDKLFEAPIGCDFMVTSTGTPEYWAAKIASSLRPPARMLCSSW